MGQYYVPANVTNSQRLIPFLQNAWEILGNRDFHFWLSLLHLDLGNQDYRGQRSLQNLCLKFLCKNEQHYSPTLIEHLPKPLLRKMDATFLSEQLVGEWAGDRLIITGNYSDFSPFPPNGEWKAGNLYKFVCDIGHFSDSHASELYRHFYANKDSIANRLRKLCDGKVYNVVNLDRKEFLDPRAYAGENTVGFGFMDTSNDVMDGLIISLIHSTGSGYSGDIPSSVTSQGMWAGDRITICTPEQLHDFESYTDVSNASDVELVDSYDT